VTSVIQTNYQWFLTWRYTDKSSINIIDTSSSKWTSHQISHLRLSLWSSIAMKNLFLLNDNVYFFIWDIKNFESTFGHNYIFRNQNILPGCIYSIQSLCIGLNIPEAHLPVVIVRFFKHSTYWLVHGIKALRPSALPTQLGCRSGHGLHDVSPGLHRFCS
jgi:hypothetical protein